MTLKSKGVSPVIATLLMIIVAVAASAAIISIVSSSVFTKDSTNEANRIIEDLKIVQVTVDEDKTVHIYIINRGGIDSIVDRLYINDYEGKMAAVILVNKTVGVNEVIDCIVDAAGMDVWNWYEITGVTSRGNKILSKLPGNPFINDALPPLGPFFHEYVFRVSNITVNGIPILDPYVYQSLIGIDGNSYPIPSKEFAFLGYNNSFAVLYYDLQGETLEGPKNVNINALQSLDGNVLHVVTNKLPNSSMSSTIFNGTVQNPEYDRFRLNFSASLQNGNFPVSITVEFFNWKTGYYSTSGNGYWESLNMDNSAKKGEYNFSILMDSDSLFSDDGDWSARINITAGTTGNLNIKYDYLGLILGQSYRYGIDTVLMYDLSQYVEDPSNITKMIFSVTGDFPSSTSFWFNAFNYSPHNPADKHWQILGTISGSDQTKTWIFTVTGDCSDFVDQNWIVKTWIFPVDDLPEGTIIKLDQAKLLVTVREG